MLHAVYLNSLCNNKYFYSIIDSQFAAELKTSDLNEILADLEKGLFPSCSWKDLGRNLGLNYDTTLRSIESNSSKVENCLTECIVKWLQRADGVDAKGRPTWTTLVKALEQCGSKPTAEHISKKISCIQKYTVGVVYLHIILIHLNYIN